MTFASASLRVTVAATPDEIDALAPEWAALEARTPGATGFQSFQWCRGWLAASSERGPPSRPRVVTVRENRRLVMLWPLEINRYCGTAILRWIGEPMTQYGDILSEEGEGRHDWRLAAEAEIARWRDVDVFAFTRLRADGVLHSSGLPPGANGETMSAPFIDFAVASRPDSQTPRHKSLERRMRQLAAFGPSRLETIAEPARREEMAMAALAMKRQWLRDKGFLSAGLSNPVTNVFIGRLAREGFLRVHCLRVGEAVAAIDLGFVASGVYRSLLGCYDRRFACGSPGQALTRLLVAHCATEGLTGYDFLAPADPYKLQWATGATPVDACFVPVGLRGQIAAVALTRLRPFAKRLARNISASHAFFPAKPTHRRGA